MGWSVALAIACATDEIDRGDDGPPATSAGSAADDDDGPTTLPAGSESEGSSTTAAMDTGVMDGPTSTDSTTTPGSGESTAPATAGDDAADDAADDQACPCASPCSCGPGDACGPDFDPSVPCDGAPCCNDNGTIWYCNGVGNWDIDKC